MSEPDEITLLRLRPRSTETVPLVIPTDTLATIKEVAEARDMSPEALMRFYIGHGLRQDVARLARDDDAPHSSSATLQALEDAQARRRLTSFASPDNCSGIWASDPQSLKFHGVSQVKCLLACFGIAVLLAATSSGQRRSACDEAYPDFCIPPPPPDLDCKDVHGKKPFRVRGSDPHHFDRDGDGWACEPRPMRH